MQDKSRLGKRYTCFKCGARFYDLNKPEAICPKCKVDQIDDPTPDPRVAVMARYKVSKPPIRAPKVTTPVADDATEDIPTPTSEVEK